MTSWTLTVTGDRVGVGPAGDLDHDGARCWRLSPAPRPAVLVVGRGLEGQDAAAGDAEQVVVDAGRVLGGGQDRVGLGGGAVGVGGRVIADRLLVLVGRGGGRVPSLEAGELVDVLEVHGHGDHVGVGTVGDPGYDNAAVVAAADLILVVGQVEGEDAARIRRAWSAPP